MKNTKTIAITALCLTFSLLVAQKKYEKIVYAENTIETDEATYDTKGAVSTSAYTKFNLKITNKSEDIILFKAEESKLKANNKEYVPVEKPLEVAPTKTEHKVVDIKGTEFMINSYSYEITGLYKVSTTEKALVTADFQLPPAQNEFKTGNFTCNMLDLSKQTDKTTVKFECRYSGDKVGVIHAGRAAVKLPDGEEVANANANTSPVLLQKGESVKVVLTWNRMQGGKATDMQKIKMWIVWRNTFVEADMVKLKPLQLQFAIDEAKSK